MHDEAHAPARRHAPATAPHLHCDNAHDARTSSCLTLKMRCRNCGAIDKVGIFGDGRAESVVG